MTYLPQWLPARGRRWILELAKMPLGRRLVRGAAASVVMTAVSVVLGLANSAVLGRLLGPERYGAYSFALLVLGVATVPFWYGMSTLLTRETGRVMAAGSPSDLSRLLGWSYGWVAWISLAVTAVWLLAVAFFGDRLGSERYWACLAAVPLISLSVLMPVNSTLLRGIGGLVRSQFCDLVARPSFALAAIALVLLAEGLAGLTAEGALTAQMLATIGASCLSGYWLRLGWHDLRLQPPEGAPAYAGRYSATALGAFSAYAAVIALSSSIDSLMLSFLTSNATLGIYRIAMVAVQLIGGLTAAVSTIAQPSIALLHTSGDHGRLQRLLTANARGTALLATPPVLVFVLFGRPLLNLFFGAAYTSGSTALAIGALGQLAVVLFGPVAGLLTMTGHERLAMGCQLAGVATNAALCFALIPPFGLNGAAAASAIGGVLTAALMSLSGRRLTGLRSSAFSAR